MEGSGLEKLLVQVYSEKNVVNHRMSGKAISSSLRELYLVDSALPMILFNILKGTLTLIWKSLYIFKII